MAVAEVKRTVMIQFGLRVEGVYAYNIVSTFGKSLLVPDVAHRHAHQICSVLPSVKEDLETHRGFTFHVMPVEDSEGFVSYELLLLSTADMDDRIRVNKIETTINEKITSFRFLINSAEATKFFERCLPKQQKTVHTGF